MSIARADALLLTEEDLAPWAQREMELAYQQRGRAKASREDFAAGWIAAAISLRSVSSFRLGALERAADAT